MSVLYPCKYFLFKLNLVNIKKAPGKSTTFLQVIRTSYKTAVRGWTESHFIWILALTTFEQTVSREPMSTEIDLEEALASAAYRKYMYFGTSTWIIVFWQPVSRKSISELLGACK